MIEAVIVSTARTPIGKAYRGALNNTEGPTMAGHVIGEAVMAVPRLAQPVVFDRVDLPRRHPMARTGRAGIEIEVEPERVEDRLRSSRGPTAGTRRGTEGLAK